MRSLISVIHLLGSVLALFAVLFLLPIGTALYYHEAAISAFLTSALLSLVVGLLIRAATQRFRTELKARDGYLLVTLTWVALTAMATVPLLLLVPELSFTRAFFEAMSGLSSTGSTVLSGLDTLPRALVLWRHALSWLGGLGLIVMAVAILPLLGIGGMQMYRADAPGPIKDAKLAPRIMQTARLLWFVYVGLTAACTLALRAAGMNWFDAICHAFSVLSLGAFSTHDASIGYYHSPLIETVLAVFMVIAAVNFATHFLALHKGEPGTYARDPEARWMLFWIVLSGVLVSINVSLSGTYPDFLTTARYVAFNLVSMATTCGLVSTDYGQWPVFAPMWMLFLSCLCASTGSTGGGDVHAGPPPGGRAAEDRGPAGAQSRGLFGAGLHLPVLHHHRRAHLRAADVRARFHVLGHRDHRQRQQRRTGPQPGRARRQLRRAQRFPAVDVHGGDVPRARRDLHRADPVHAGLLAKVAPAWRSAGGRRRAAIRS